MVLPTTKPSEKAAEVERPASGASGLRPLLSASLGGQKLSARCKSEEHVNALASLHCGIALL